MLFAKYQVTLPFSVSSEGQSSSGTIETAETSKRSKEAAEFESVRCTLKEFRETFGFSEREIVQAIAEEGLQPERREITGALTYDSQEIVQAIASRARRVDMGLRDSAQEFLKLILPTLTSTVRETVRSELEALMAIRDSRDARIYEAIGQSSVNLAAVDEAVRKFTKMISQVNLAAAAGIFAQVPPSLSSAFRERPDMRSDNLQDMAEDERPRPDRPSPETSDKTTHKPPRPKVGQEVISRSRPPAGRPACQGGIEAVSESLDADSMGLAGTSDSTQSPTSREVGSTASTALPQPARLGLRPLMPFGKYVLADAQIEAAKRVVSLVDRLSEMSKTAVREEIIKQDTKLLIDGIIKPFDDVLRPVPKLEGILLANLNIVERYVERRIRTVPPAFIYLALAAQNPGFSSIDEFMSKLRIADLVDRL